MGEQLKEDCENVLQMIQEMDEDDLKIVLEKTGFCTLGAKIDETPLELETIVSSSVGGVIGAEARFQEGTNVRTVASVVLTAEALKLDHDVLNLVAPVFLEEGKKYATVPSYYLTAHDAWRYVKANSTCKLIALCAVSDSSIQLACHSFEKRADWEAKIKKEKGSEYNIIKEVDVPEMRISLDVGSVLVTHEGMLFKIESGLVKTVVFEVLGPGNKRLATWKGILEKGYWTQQHFNEDFFSKKLPIVKVMPELKFKLATLNDVPWLKDEPDPLERLRALQERIAKLNPLAWNPKFEESVNNYAKMTDLKPKMSGFKTCLATLEKNIVAVEEDEAKEVTKVQQVLDTLEKCKELVEDLNENTPKEFAQEWTRISAHTKSYEALRDQKNNLWAAIGGANKCLENLEKVKAAVETRKSKTPSKKRKNEEVEHIDEDALDPQIIYEKGGTNGWVSILGGFIGQQTEFSIMVQKDKSLQHLYDGYVRALNAAQEVAAGSPNGIDVAVVAAYGNALKKHYGNKKAPASKGVKCNGCDNARVQIEDSGYCAKCYGDIVLEKRIKKFDKRIKTLDSLAEKEKKELKGKKGPHQEKLKQYEKLDETMAKQRDKFMETHKNWQKLDEAIKDVDNFLPVAMDISSDDDDDDDDDEEEEVDEHGAKKLPNEVLHKYVDEDEEEEARHTNEEEDDDNLAHDTLLTFAALPVQAVRDELLELYLDDDKHRLLRERLTYFKEKTPEIYGIKVIDPDGDPEDYYTHFLKKSDAAQQAKHMRVGSIKAEVTTKVVNWK